MTTFTTNPRPATSTAALTLKPLLSRAAAALRTALTPAKRDPQAIIDAQIRREAARRSVDNLLR